MKLRNLLSSAVVLATLSGCSAFTIGEEEFSCSGKPDHGLCMGPLEVYELTNNQDNLEHMMMDHDDENDEAHKENKVQRKHNRSGIADDITYTYKERSLRRQTREDYDKAEIVNITSDRAMNTATTSGDELDDLRTYNYGPYDIAPEPLAVLEEAKAMRIYVAAWEDKSGDLNIPGFVYVELKERRWVSGHQAQMRPSRVLPFQVIQKSKTQENRKKGMARGVDPLSVSRPTSQMNY